MSIIEEMNKIADKHSQTTVYTKFKDGSRVILITSKEQDPFKSLSLINMEILKETELKHE